jgi:DNA-binding IclR family transcriptional regulator
VAHALDSPPTLVRPVRNAVEILRLLAASGQHSTVTAIARELELNASTCFNILRTLAYTGVIEFDSVTRTYRTGPGAIDLANKALLTDAATATTTNPALQHLARTYSLSVMVLQRIREDRLALVSLIDSTAPVRIHIRLGQRFPLLVGSNGRVWAAFGDISAEQIRRQWPAVRWNNPITLDEYRAQVALVLKRKLAVDDGDHVAGMFTASVPVIRGDGTLRYALSVGWARGQHGKTTTRRILSELKQIAAELGPH